jgi:hypothetical protein
MFSMLVSAVSTANPFAPVSCIGADHPSSSNRFGSDGDKLPFDSDRLSIKSRRSEILQGISSTCGLIPLCLRSGLCALQANAASATGDTEAKIDTAIVFEDYISLRSRADSSAGHKNTVRGGVAHNHSPGRRMSNCPGISLSRELPRLDSTVLDMRPANGPASNGTLTLDNVGPLLLMTAGGVPMAFAVSSDGRQRAETWVLSSYFS